MVRSAGERTGRPPTGALAGDRDSLHGRLICPRRVRRLGDLLAGVLPPGARVLDVGCGDGRLAKRVLERRPDLTLAGIDVLVRARTHVPVARFDGRTIPHG